MVLLQSVERQVLDINFAALKWKVEDSDIFLYHQGPFNICKSKIPGTLNVEA